jgi:hypothetical protein
MASRTASADAEKIFNSFFLYQRFTSGDAALRETLALPRNENEA